VAAKGEHPQHGGVDDHPLGAAVADGPERGRVAAVADDHQHDEDEAERAREDGDQLHRAAHQGADRDRLDVEEEERHEREEAVYPAAIEREGASPDGPDGGEDEEHEHPTPSV
jgi:hypothetical protein